VRLKLYQPFRIRLRVSLWLAWAVIAVAVLTIGNRSSEPNPPLGLLLLGLGLAVPGMLAVLALASDTLWNRLLDPEPDLRMTRIHLYWLAGLGVLGAAMMGSALNRLF